MRRKQKSQCQEKKFHWPWLLLPSAGLLAVGFWVWTSTSPVSQSAKPNMLVSSKAESTKAIHSKYAGSESCRECHTKAFDGWTNSHHALAERAVDSTVDHSAFEPARAFTIGSQSSEVRRSKGKFEIITDGLDQKRRAFTPQFVIGTDPLRQFMIPAAGGRYQVTEIAYDPRTNDWFDVFGNEDRKPGEWGHWTGRGMTWNSMCAVCHNTRLQKNYDEETDSYSTTMAERGVGCEACHGPMADHVAWQKKFPQQKGDPTIKKFDWKQTLATCGSCHARRAEMTGDFVPGENFADQFALTIPDETEVFYPDCQIRDEDYEYTSFLSSKMFAAGVRCTDCHEPHTSKPLAEGNALCLRCHGAPVPPAPKIDPIAHSFHRDGEPGSKCVDCHMPQTAYMQRHWRHDHGLTIPDPLLTKQYNIPNACNRCHKDKSTDWALEAVNKWYGVKMERPSRTRAQIVAQARNGDNTAVEGLLKMAREEKIPLWRAVATGLLRRWCEQTNVTLRLIEKTADSDALVRANAARSLEPLVAAQIPNVRAALNRLLQDPSRSVRVEAAWALRAEIDLGSRAGLDLMAYLRSNADQPSGALQRGILHLNRKETDLALKYFQRSVNWDTNSSPSRHALAMALSTQGKMDAALRELEAACRLAPRDPEYRYKLALALNELGRLSDATSALEETVRLDPQFSRAWYNLGLAYSHANHPERAVEALARAESLDPQSARIPYARATVLLRLQRKTEAQTALARALALQKDFGEAKELLEQLSRQN